MIPEEMLPALMGVVPATLITCCNNGIPNITNISRVWYVDQNHVAIANHMLKKSIRNLQENPYAFIRTMDTNTFSTWEIEVKYEGPRTNGEIFVEMTNQFGILSMMLNSELPITVQSAEIFSVLSARICEEESSHFRAVTDFYNILLEKLEKKFGWDCSVVWFPDDLTQDLHLALVRGLDEESAGRVLLRISQWAVQQKKSIRISNIRSQYQYAFTTFLHQDVEKEKFSVDDYRHLTQNYLSIPIKGEGGKILAVIGTQNDKDICFNIFTEKILEFASHNLSELVEKLRGFESEQERQIAIDHALERIRIEGSKRTGEVKTNLSPREIQVAVQVARGLSNEEIANLLFLSKRTVTTHLERIYQKLGIKSRSALTSYVMENGLSDYSS